MKLDELINKLSSEPLIENKYCIGRASDNKYCIMQENSEWVTFYYERGCKDRLKRYVNEEEACIAFYETLMKVKSRMLK